MHRKIYRSLGIVCLAGLFASFAVFVYLMITMDDPFDDDILLYIFGWLGVSGVLTFMMMFCFVKYFRYHTSSYQAQTTKRCVSCGEVISVTEHTCPRCYTIQPADGKGQYGK